MVGHNKRPRGRDVVGLLQGEVVKMKKKIVAKDVVGLQVGDSKNNREFE
jgi:hypothetical protein